MRYLLLGQPLQICFGLWLYWFQIGLSAREKVSNEGANFPIISALKALADVTKNLKKRVPNRRAERVFGASLF
jgi:hypothetical protein